MASVLIDRLLGRLIDLEKEKRDDRRALFTDCVAPTYAAFEEVHRDYLSSLARYREVLQVDPPLEAAAWTRVLAELQNDSRFSAHLRHKTLIQARRIAEMDAQCSGFLREILLYLGFDDSGIVDTRPAFNRARQRLVDEWQAVLDRASEPGEPWVIQGLVDALTRSTDVLQDRYARVTREYVGLQTNLLKR